MEIFVEAYLPSAAWISTEEFLRFQTSLFGKFSRCSRLGDFGGSTVTAALSMNTSLGRDYERPNGSLFSHGLIAERCVRPCGNSRPRVCPRGRRRFASCHTPHRHSSLSGIISGVFKHQEDNLRLCSVLSSGRRNDERCA